MKICSSKLCIQWKAPPFSGAARNFVREGLVTWCLSDCSFRIFGTVKNTIKHQRKMWASLFRGGPWPLRPHSGCALPPFLFQGTRSILRSIKFPLRRQTAYKCLWRAGVKTTLPFFFYQNRIGRNIEYVRIAELRFLNWTQSFFTNLRRVAFRLMVWRR